MTDYDWNLQWHSSKRAMCDRIRSQKSILKIIIKTKNETTMLRKWLPYHLRIVGNNNIILFDNMSTDPETFSIYSDFSSHVQIARFAGYPDRIHSTVEFPELFQALRDSCDYYMFLDTDEFLYWFQPNGRAVNDETLVNLVAAHPQSQIFPGTWLENVPFYDNRFYWMRGYGSIEPSWRPGIISGKPMVSARVEMEGRCRHNIELDPKLYSDCACTNVFIAHLTTLSPKQRIATNINKLQALKVIGENEGVSKVLEIDTEQIGTALVRSYCMEVKAMADLAECQPDDSEELPVGVFKVKSDGEIAFYDEDQRRLLEEYLTNGRQFISVLSSPAVRQQVSSGKSTALDGPAKSKTPEAEKQQSKLQKKLQRLQDGCWAYQQEHGEIWPGLLGGPRALPAAPLLQNCKIVPHRVEIIKALPKGGKFAEIGIIRGDFSVRILKVIRPDEVHIFGTEFGNIRQENRQKIEAYGKATFHMGDPSTQLAQHGADEKNAFDIIYFNADHSYEVVFKALTSSLQVLKRGGYIICNNYTTWDSMNCFPCGAFSAINRFATENDLSFTHLALEPNGYHDVALRRPS